VQRDYSHAAPGDTWQEIHNAVHIGCNTVVKAGIDIQLVIM